MSPIHQVWPKPSCKAQWKGEEDKADRGIGGKTISGNGQAWSSEGPRGQWRTGEKMEKTGYEIICGAPLRLGDRWWWWRWFLKALCWSPSSSSFTPLNLVESKRSMMFAGSFLLMIQLSIHPPALTAVCTNEVCWMTVNKTKLDNNKKNSGYHMWF